MKKILIATCIQIACMTSAFAQDKEISAKELKEIEAQVKYISVKIEATLLKDEKLYTAMKKEIEILSAIKTEKDRNHSIELYKSKYNVLYGEVVAKAGINMKNIVSDFNLKYKNYTFTLNNGYAIAFKSKTTLPSGGQTLPATPIATTISISDFLESKNINCGLIGFADVTFEDNSIKSDATGAVAGGCSAKGELNKTITLPIDAKSVTLKITGKTEASGYAVGVVGTSATSSSAGVYVMKQLGTGSAILSTRSEISLFAPVLWIANNTQSADFSETIDLTEYKGGSMDIMAFASTFSASGLCCATNSNAKVTITKAELIVSK